MDDRGASHESLQGVDRHRLRVRTIEVSFAAAVSSAHHDLDTEGAEREALIEGWRAWSLATLERYRDEILAEDPRPPEEELATLLSELEAAAAAVRRT